MNNLQEILIVLDLKMGFVNNVLRELFLTFKESVSLLIHLASLMIKVMDFVLHAMLAMNLTETEDASRNKLQLETLTAKYSKMEFVLNALKELFSICLEHAS